jgi:hypothetical protein
MADERPEDIELSSDFGRTKRAPPTLDLEATEVSDKSATEVSDKSATGETDEATAGVNEAATEATGETADAGAGASATATTPAGAAPRTRWVASALISAISGASAAGLILAVVWLSGWPDEAASPAPVAQTDPAAIDSLAARVANLESRPPAALAPKSDVKDDSAPRIEALEASIASLRQELTASRSRTESLTAAVDELKAAPREASPPPDLSAINERLAQLERTIRAQIAAAALQNAKPADDAPLRRVVAAALLDVSVRHGDPYAAPLEAAKALAPDPAVLKPLEPFAASGVPGPAALSRDLLALLPKAAPQTATTTGAGIVDRLQAGAARLVRIERTDGAGSTDRSAVIVRAAAAAQRNDIAGARHELDALPGPDRAAVQPGIDRLDAHDAALAASRQFAADAMAALTKPAP